MNSVERLKTVILNNWQLKLLATGLAALVVYEIRQATSFEVPYDIPIKVEAGEGIAILDQPKTVKVFFRGSQDDLRRLNQNEMAAVIKPKATDPTGSEKIAIKSGDIVGAPGIRKVQIEPRIVTITFDREIQKDVAVAKPQVLGEPLIGKVELDYQPRTVRISGSYLRLMNKQEIGTEPVDVEGRVESFTKRVKILGALVTKVQPDEVTVNVNIVTELVTREWTNVMVRGILTPGFTGEIRFEPPYVKVGLKGHVREVEKVASNAVMAFVDCTGVMPWAVTSLPVNVHIPVGADVDAVVEPATVRTGAGNNR